MPTRDANVHVQILRQKCDKKSWKFSVFDTVLISRSSTRDIYKQSPTEQIA